MSVLPVGFGSALGGYQIERSLRFNSADSAYLNRTLGSSGNRKTWTWSGWIKGMGSGDVIFGAAGSTGGQGALYFTSSSLTLREYAVETGSETFSVITTAKYRDPSAWYHIVAVFDTTQATSSNRIKLYVNGIQVTALSTASYPSLNFDAYNINNSSKRALIGTENYSGSGTMNGYMTEVNFIDGQALTPSSFGETDSNTGVWKPKTYTGTYGTNGFYLKFADNSGTTSTTLGKDSSGNGNNWTPNNFSVTAGAGNDSLVDSPTAYGTDTGVGGEVRGNYCTLNPLGNPVLSGMTFSNGNLTVTTSSARQHIIGTMSLPTTGKWYWECNKGNSLTGYQAAGIALINTAITSSPSYNYPYNVWGYNDLGYKIVNGVQTTGYTTSASTSDVWGFAFDADAGTLGCYLNNTLLFTISSLTSQYIPYLGTETGCTPSINFGQRPFAYTAPSGYKALCTQNLPTPTIGATSTTQANKYFTPYLYTADGTSPKSRTGIGFAPDFLWFKSRSTTFSHALYDQVRGTNKGLQTNTTAAENTYTLLSTFGSDGFTTTTDGTVGNILNDGTNTYVTWCWNAGGSTVTNTSGTISAQVRANTTSGFSIVTYTGTGSAATVGHGLGVTPAMYIVKIRNGANNWVVWHNKLANTTTSYILLDSTAAETTSANIWGSTAATSTTIGVGTAAATNANASTYVAYCFAPVAGYSAFGSYTGNGSADGPFVYTGFRPAFVMIKPSSAADNWQIEDSARNTFNVINTQLFPNLSNAEATSTTRLTDFLSNGFKIRGTNAGVNGNGTTFIYAAFAESPFKYALAR